jgi:hypothetical protein
MRGKFFKISIGIVVLGLIAVGASAVLKSPAPANAQGPLANPGISPEVRTLPPPRLRKSDDPILELNPRTSESLPTSLVKGFKDPLVRIPSQNMLNSPNPIVNFDGISWANGGGFPPDTVGDVGPNHYLQMVNGAFAIYDKSGNTLKAPTDINSLWTGQGNACETERGFDPVVRYDRLANRWLLTQFNFASISTPPWSICIAISQTGDPLGAYYLYRFEVTDYLPDYPKIGVWPDAYYMSTKSPSGVYAFDRTKMLAGQTLGISSYINFHTGTNFMLPSDLDGSTPPPAGSPNYFYTRVNSLLLIYEFKVNFTTPANSTFNSTLALPTADAKTTLCGSAGGPPSQNCIPQPGTTQKLDSLVVLPMYRFQYRNLGTFETLVGNQTVDASGTDQAGIRWFELRKSGAGAWYIFQEGTHSPDANHRWMGSIAMDQAGNIALGYSVSSTTVFPSIRYATRLAADPLGTLQTEVTLQAGAASQTSSNRWGDYSSMNVDPADDCTFWYTNEYLQDSAMGYRTRIGAFKMPTCGLSLPNKLYLPLLTR